MLFNNKKCIRYSFVLLEVIVALAILGIATATILRSFTLSVAAVRKNEIRTTAIALAEKKLEEIDLKNLEDGKYSGDFGEEYPNYYWESSIKSKEVEYENVVQEVDPEKIIKPREILLTIFYDDKVLRSFVALSIDTFLLGAEKFTYESKNAGELY